MDDTTRTNIRHIFLSPRPNFGLLQASWLLGMTLKDVKREVEDGGIVAGSTGMGVRIGKEEMMAAAMRVWEMGVIEAALGDDAASVLPRRSGWWSSGHGFRGISGTCFGSWRGGRGRLSMRCWRASSRMWLAPMPRSWRECLGWRWPCSGQRFRDRAGVPACVRVGSVAE